MYSLNHGDVCSVDNLDRNHTTQQQHGRSSVQNQTFVFTIYEIYIHTLLQIVLYTQFLFVLVKVNYAASPK